MVMSVAPHLWLTLYMPFRRYNVTEKRVDLVNRQLVTMATFLNGLKNNLMSFIYGQSSTTAAHFAKISLVDVDIVILV